MAALARPKDLDDQQCGDSQPKQVLHYDARLLGYLQRMLGDDGCERVCAVYYGPDGSPLADATVGTGGIGEVRLRFRPIAEQALQVGATGLLLAHNHPSGICRPSKTDIATTRHIAGIMAAIDIALLDHLIITSGRAYSMRAGGLL